MATDGSGHGIPHAAEAQVPRVQAARAQVDAARLRRDALIACGRLGLDPKETARWARGPMGPHFGWRPVVRFWATRS